MEAKLQSEIIRWLKSNGAYVIKTRPGPGTPVGCPDIIALKGVLYVAIEVKASAKSPFRTGQQATLQYLRSQSRLVFVAHPENWPIIKEELDALFF